MYHRHKILNFIFHFFESKIHFYTSYASVLYMIIRRLLLKVGKDIMAPKTVVIVHF
jgi:hypothetical protein